MTTLVHDVKYALRLMRQAPGFSCVAVLSLALGIGANTVIFSVVNAVLLRPLPYVEPDRLVRLIRDAGNGYVTMPEFEFWKEHSTAFDSVAAYRGGADERVVVDGKSERVSIVAATASFFRTLGAAPFLGREFNSEETRPGGPQSAVLTHRLWQLVFDGDPLVLGRRIMFGNDALTVVGVLPAAFWFPQDVDAFVPLRVTGSATDTGTNTSMIGRLKADSSWQQAALSTRALGQAFRQENRLPYALPQEYEGLGVIPYQQWLTGDVRLILLVVFGAVGVLLLITCLNLTSFVLARLATRQRELAMRLALGGSRSRLLRQFITENLLLSVTGSISGLVFVLWLFPGLVAFIPFELPASSPISVDWHVLAFTSAVALIAGVLLGLPPYLSAAHMNINEALKTGSRAAGASVAGQRARSFLVVGQVGLSVVLLIASALLTQSLYRLTHQDLGFDPKDLVTFRLSVPEGADTNAVQNGSFRDVLLERLRSLSGVRNVAAVNTLPFRGPNNFPAQRQGHPEQSIGGMEIRVVTPEYFETMAIPIRRGRPFNANDDESAQPVIIVNETVVRRWWQAGNPVGDGIVIGLFRDRVIPEGAPPGTPRQVVGVAADTKSVFIKEPPRPTLYIPAAQASETIAGLTWILRGTFPPALPAQLERAIAEADPRMSIEGLQTMDEIVALTTVDARFDAVLFGMFAGEAILLVAIGIYGLLAFSVTQRMHEIGTRIAIGASRSHVLRLVLGRGLLLVTMGLICGIFAAVILTRFLSSFLFDVQTRDPWSFVAGSLLMLVVGLLASYIPALRATKIDPMIAMRSQ